MGPRLKRSKYDAAAFGVFMGSTGFSRFQGGLGEWGEWDEVYPQLAVPRIPRDLESRSMT